jgi:carbonic anhydrase
VIENVYNVCNTSTIQKAWKERNLPQIHGWVYDIGNGLVKDLDVNFNDPEALHHLKVD